MKKQLLFLFAAILALSAASCGSEPATDLKTTPDSSSSEESSEAPSSLVYDIPEPDLPALDYQGQNYTGLCQVFFAHLKRNSTCSDNQNGDFQISRVKWPLLSSESHRREAARP